MANLTDEKLDYDRSICKQTTFDVNDFMMKVSQFNYLRTSLSNRVYATNQPFIKKHKAQSQIQTTKLIKSIK